MNSLLIGMCLLGLAACAEGKWGADEEDDVAVLTKDNFDDFVKLHRFVFVKFYAPWCGHCKSVAPGYSQLSRRMKGEERGVPIAKVDATVEKELAERFGVKGFPTLKFFIDGEPVDYGGAREEDPIYNWIQKKTGPITSELKTLEEVKALEKKRLAVLLVVDEGKEEMLKAFNSLAASFDDLPFHFTFNDEVRQQYQVEFAVALIIFRDFDDGKKFLVNEKQLSAEAMRNFVNAHRFPLVMPFEQEAAERIFGSESPAIFLFTEEEDGEAARAFKEVAKTKRDSGVLFSRAAAGSGLGARLAEFLGVTAQDTGVVRLVKFSQGGLLKYRLEGKPTVASIGQFIDDWRAGKLTAYFKSETVPASNEQPVKVVVGDTFEQLVLDPNRHVLLEAYAPWCGHCKQLEPVFNELAARLAGVEDLVIAKMDATANEHPSLNVKGFPTLKLYKRGEKARPVDFSGERTLDGFVAFLEKELGRKLEADAAPATEDL